jgi:hypothetical protein
MLVQRHFRRVVAIPLNPPATKLAVSFNHFTSPDFKPQTSPLMKLTSIQLSQGTTQDHSGTHQHQYRDLFKIFQLPLTGKKLLRLCHFISPVTFYIMAAILHLEQLWISYLYWT